MKEIIKQINLGNIILKQLKNFFSIVFWLIWILGEFRLYILSSFILLLLLFILSLFLFLFILFVCIFKLILLILETLSLK